jgi:hypothetical protein
MARQAGFNTVYSGAFFSSLPVGAQTYLQNLGVVVTDLTEFRRYRG